MDNGDRKSWILIVAGVLLCILSYHLLSRGSDVQTEQVEEDRSRYKVGVILDSSKYDDGWNAAHGEGMAAASRKLGLEMEYRLHVTEEECEAVMQELIESGCREIFLTSFEYGKAGLKVAKANPFHLIYHVSGDKTAENMKTLFGRMYQARYLTGIVAGMQSETGHIGYVAAIPIPEVVRGINAFTLGVRSVNPEAVVHVRWSWDWDCIPVERKLSEQLLKDYPVDVLTFHQNGTTVAKVAAMNGVWSIGYHYDTTKNFPETMLTAAVWNWKNLYTSELKKCLDGKFVSGQVWSGMETDTVQLAPLNKRVLKPGIAERVEKERQLIATDKKDVFYGPVRDQDGKERVLAGEAMTDRDLLSMDWLVEGVEGRIEAGPAGQQ